MSSTSTNPVQNKVVNTALAGKASSSHTHNLATTSTAGFLSAADKSKLESLTIQGDTSGYLSKFGDEMLGPLLLIDTHYYNQGHFEGIGSGSFATSAASTSFYAAIGLSNFNQNTSLSLRFNGYNHNNPRVRIDFTVGILITYSSGTRKISTNGWYSEGMLTPSSVTARISGSTLYIYYNFATLANYYTANTDNIFVRVDAIIHDAPENGITGLSAEVGTETPPTSGLTTLTKLAIASGTYVSWANITGKPNTFPPSTHNQAISTITGRQNLKIQLNGGKTEGTNQFTFNGSTAKTVNITAGKIGAAASSHTHSNLTIRFNGETQATYNGSGAQTVDITASGIGAAASTHTHKYAGSSSAGGAATSAAKWSTSRVLNGLSVNGTVNLVNFGTCSTPGATAAKTITINGGSYFSLSTGAEVTVKFTNTNTVSGLTLNVNGTGAKAIYYRGKNIPYHVILANKLYTFRYDGSYWQLVGNASSLNKTYLTDSNLGTSSGSPGPNNINDLIIDNELNYLDIYVDSRATAARYYLKIPDKEVGTIIDIGIRKSGNNTKLQAVQLARAGNTGPTIYLPDGSGGYPNVDIAVGVFVRLYRADENGWIMYRYATV